MPRTARAVEAGLICHALNRGNVRMRLFRKPQDYVAFQHILAEAQPWYPVDPGSPQPACPSAAALRAQVPAWLRASP